MPSEQTLADTSRQITRTDLLLAFFVAGEGYAYNATQLQKGMFLLERNLTGLELSDGGYNFTPGNYGPWDSELFSDARALARLDQVWVVDRNNTLVQDYAVSKAGVDAAASVLERLTDKEKDFVAEVSAWVRGRTRLQIIASVVNEYPDMATNLIEKPA